MDFKQIKELINLINDSQLGELLIEEKDFKLRLRHQSYSNGKSGGQMVYATQTASEAAEAKAVHAAAGAPPDTSATEEDAVDTSHLITVKSPMIGTFYRASGPDKPPYIKAGDHVNKEDVLCIIEAMKLFNEIESEHSGRIVKVLVENESPVEYDQPLFLIDPNG